MDIRDRCLYVGGHDANAFQVLLCNRVLPFTRFPLKKNKKLPPAFHSNSRSIATLLEVYLLVTPGKNEVRKNGMQM